jgi:hypothetical protein
MAMKNVSGGRGSAGGTNPVQKKTSPSAQNSIDSARKALGSTKPTAEELKRRLAKDKANEIAKIRRQGRNTR